VEKGRTVGGVGAVSMMAKKHQLQKEKKKKQKAILRTQERIKLFQRRRQLASYPYTIQLSELKQGFKEGDSCPLDSHEDRGKKRHLPPI